MKQKSVSIWHFRAYISVYIMLCNSGLILLQKYTSRYLISPYLWYNFQESTQEFYYAIWALLA